MLRLFRSGSVDSETIAVLSAYADGNLLDYRFQFAAAALLRSRRLTKFRLESPEAVVGFDLYGGVVLGVEMLGLSPGRAGIQLERFSEELPEVDEIPVLGMELDGRRTPAMIDFMAITQPAALTARYATETRQFELSFDVGVRASCFGGGSILYNAHDQVAGIRLNLESISKPVGMGGIPAAARFAAMHAAQQYGASIGRRSAASGIKMDSRSHANEGG